MVGVIVLVLLTCTVLGYTICAFVKKDPYEKRISDEQQLKYIEKWSKTHKNKKVRKS